VENLEPNNRVVCSDDEQLILVDSEDRDIGFVAKADAHLGRGTLHRAFSVFVFNPVGELLLQQRAKSKRLWPGYRSNTCCSHPRRGEKMDSAIRRRFQEELGLRAELETSTRSRPGATSPQALQAEIKAAPETFTPWFKLEWARIWGTHMRVLGAMPWDRTRDRLDRARNNLLRTLPDNSCDVDALDQPGCG
jgi:isopentenyl-diphosphate Delta-isomerase